MREIVLDTETTGIDPEAGHRIVEIACIELVFRRPTGNSFHRYINPERDMPQDAESIHGLNDAFLSDKPIFEEVVDELLVFIGTSPLIIHNAAFDKRFLDTEMKRINRTTVALTNDIVDTLDCARKKYPHSSNSLTALCKRFGVDTSKRIKHSALLDVQLLAEVYLYLTGGLAPEFQLESMLSSPEAQHQQMAHVNHGQRTPRLITLQVEELDAHQAMVRRLHNPIWDQIALSARK